MGDSWVFGKTKYARTATTASYQPCRWSLRVTHLKTYPLQEKCHQLSPGLLFSSDAFVDDTRHSVPSRRGWYPSWSITKKVRYSLLGGSISHALTHAFISLKHRFREDPMSRFARRVRVFYGRIRSTEMLVVFDWWWLGLATLSLADHMDWLPSSIDVVPPCQNFILY